ncbi:MAG: hypothetical protein SPG50_08080, partial [Muribaculaceae bacterium]|nr:hypothetical protein [Muribaculaceae bacterium]
MRQHKVYHGSGADFDAFDNNHMSEGEGAQAYGWGTYVTEVEAIGRNYAIVNNNSLRKSKLESDIYRLKEALPFRRGEAKREGEEELKRLEEELSKFNTDWRSVLYTVEIPDDTGSNYLHWDKPVGREKSDKKDQIFLQDSLGENQMGSRVDSRMAEIGDYYVGRDLDDNARAIVDVYSGKADNKTVTIMRDGKVHKVVMRQGNENNAGAKHSLFRHYGTNVGVITKDDLLLIPEVIKKGEMQNKGSRRAYKLSVNGVNYTIITEKKHNREEFFDFYSNRKGDQTRTLNTQLSARDIQIGHQDATKLAKEFDNSKFGEKKAEKS